MCVASEEELCERDRLDECEDACWQEVVSGNAAPHVGQELTVS